MADYKLGEVEEEGENGFELMIDLRRREPDHRDAVQKKTFTKWVNNHLQKTNVQILDLYKDLRDGSNLLLLLEILYETNLPRETGQLRFHRLQNVQTALEFLKSQQVKLVNIRSEDIVEGSPKLTPGLIWTIILHYQISEVKVVGKPEQMSATEALLLWAQKATQGYSSVEIGNFTSSWKDGLAFNAIIHSYRPDLVDFSKLIKASPEQNLEHSFRVAEKELGVPRLLDVEDLVHTDHPDEKSVMTYVSSLYETFSKEPAVQEALHDIANNYTNRPRDKSTQERLEFDVDTGKLVVKSTQPARQVPEFVHDVREPVPGRPVVDAMAAQGFFVY